MDKLWYYTQGATQEKRGPVPESEINLLVAGGQIRPTDLLWTEGMETWAPLSSLPQLQSGTSPLSTATDALPQTALPQAPLPEGLTGWMTFMGVMTIIGGVFQCLNCIGIVMGVPMIIAGTALLAAKSSIADRVQVDSSLSLFFNKLYTFVKLSGIVYIIGIIFFIVIFIMYFGVIMSMLSGHPGFRP